MKRNAEYRTGHTAACACMVADALVTAWPARASDHAEDRRKALVDDAAVTVHFRTYYFDRDKPDGSRSSAWAGGGWLGYESGWIRGFLQLGAVGYTSQPLWAPDDKDGTLLRKPGQDGRPWGERDFPLGMNLLSLYGNIRNYMGPENLSMAIFDDPTLVDEMLERLKELARRQEQEAERQRQMAGSRQAGGLPPLLALASVPPLRVLRRDLPRPRPSALVAYALGAGVIAALIGWQAQDLKTGAIMVGGVGGLIVAAAIAAWLLIVALKRLPQRGITWRFGLANLRRRPLASSLQVGALALGLMALLLLTVVRGDLDEELAGEPACRRAEPLRDQPAARPGRRRASGDAGDRRPGDRSVGREA